MERYNKCNALQKQILDKLYEYLGFNEIVSFEEYLNFMFLNAKSGVGFDHIVNHTLEHIVKSFWKDYPQYRENNYIRHFWIKQNDFMSHLAAGSADEYDPKGLIRYFVKENFNKLVATKR